MPLVTYMGSMNLWMDNNRNSTFHPLPILPTLSPFLPCLLLLNNEMDVYKRQQNFLKPFRVWHSKKPAELI